jgi:hypothetical protein
LWVEAHPTVVLQLFTFMHMNGYTNCETNVMKEKQQLQKRKVNNEKKNTHTKNNNNKKKTTKKQGRHMHTHSHS